MTELANQFLVAFAVLALVFIGPMLVLGMLTVRKRRARRRRRSPLGIDLLRFAGHSLREQIDRLQEELQAHATVTMLLPPMMALVLLGQWVVTGRSTRMPVLLALAIVGIGFLVWAATKAYRMGEKMDHWRAGYDAEVAVGQALDRLMRHGAWVFHDVPGDGFNIDHVVVAREGVFAVETKGYTKLNAVKGRAAARVVYDGTRLAFPTWTTTEPIDQAERQAKWLSRWLAQATADAVAAEPVVALPGWFVDRQGAGNVRVLSGGELEHRLLTGRTQAPLSDAVLTRMAHQLDQRCRTVKATYSGGGSATG